MAGAEWHWRGNKAPSAQSPFGWSEVAEHRRRATFTCMDWRSPNEAGRKPPSGDYVVFHERPYPHQLDRAFRVGAIVVAVAVDALTATWLVLRDGGASTVKVVVVAVALGFIPAALAYGFVRAMAAIRRNGRELVDVAGPDGLKAVLAKIRADAKRRERIVLQAWDGLVSEVVA